MARPLALAILFFSLATAQAQPSLPGTFEGLRVDLARRLGLDTDSARQSAVLFVPDYFTPAEEGEITLLIHLHSAPWASSAALYTAHANAVLFALHLGPLSSPYRSYFGDPTRLPALLDTIQSVLKEHGITDRPRVGDLILSSFSAGYAGIREILKAPALYRSVKAVILADGLHADSDSTVMDTQMADFVRYARDATEGRTIFLLTHSSIPTTGYRSTTETADYILRLLTLARQKRWINDGIGQLTSAADSGYFHLRGYSGESAADHMKHLYGMHVMIAGAARILKGRR